MVLGHGTSMHSVLSDRNTEKPFYFILMFHLIYLALPVTIYDFGNCHLIRQHLTIGIDKVIISSSIHWKSKTKDF